VIAPFVRVTGDAHAPSEITGPVFNPTRDRLYFSSQRGPSNRDLAEILPGFVPIEGLGAIGKAAGVTYEISGPFRGRMEEQIAAPPETEAPTTTVSPVTTLAAAADSQTTPAPAGDSDGGSSGTAIGIGIGVVAAAVVGGAVAFRKKRMDGGSGDQSS
jgi:hypothetical protein